jgi:RimJ/RimL family protein N-acetyltransferase
MAPSIIETARLRLHPWGVQDTELLIRLSSIVEVMRFIGPGVLWPRARAEEVAAAQRQHWTEHGFGWRPAVEKATNEVVGFMALNFAGEGTVGLDAAEYEIGWWLAPWAWGRGFEREGALAMRDEAFDALAAPSVVARIQPANERSIAVARVAGLTRDFSTSGKTGEPVDVYRLVCALASWDPAGPRETDPSLSQRVVVRPDQPDSPRSEQILRRYLEDVVSRYHGRPLTASQLAAAIAESPSDDLASPHGVLLLALVADVVVGCIGLRFVEHRTGEITRLFVNSAYRRRGIARRLLAELERVARNRGLARLRLDTRHNLVEARELYARSGFREVEPSAPRLTPSTGSKKISARHRFRSPRAVGARQSEYDCASTNRNSKCRGVRPALPRCRV